MGIKVAQRGPLRSGLALLVILLASSFAAVDFSTAALGKSASQMDPYPWVYLRDGEPVRPGENLVELAAVGDTNLGRAVRPESAFSQVGPWLAAADLAFTNLECAFAQETADVAPGDSPAGPFRLIAQPTSARLLSRAGFDIAGLANNHTLDAGPAGLEETIRRLAAVGVIPVGAGIDADAAARPVIQNLKGLQIAFLAFNAVPSPDPPSPGWGVAGWEREQALQAVRRASIQAEAVVVSMHWGYEYEPRADPAQVDLAQALISAGADLVIGHHPHVAQEVIVQKRADGTSGAAALSLGNFLFDQGLTGTDHGLALRAFFDQDGLRAVQMLPVQAGLRPRLASLEQPLPAVQHIQPRQEMEIYICAQNACAETGTSSKTANLAGIFHTGQIDLTGDQQMEEVQLKDRRIMVYEKGRLTWESPPEWRILDLALGDPDADGRNDLVVALEKPDAKGVMQSHPFVIGYRGGVYRTVWGGSPVRDPVIEVELEDVNGDGEIELVVLEEEREGKGRAVTVWHWHGWGFSLDWRSPYGQFEDMHAQGQEIRVNNSQE